MENLTPENDMQELWELSGRVRAALVYIRSAAFPERDVLIAMLGGEGDVPEKETAGAQR